MRTTITAALLLLLLAACQPVDINPALIGEPSVEAKLAPNPEPEPIAAVEPAPTTPPTAFVIPRRFMESFNSYDPACATRTHLRSGRYRVACRTYIGAPTDLSLRTIRYLRTYMQDMGFLDLIDFEIIVHNQGDGIFQVQIMLLKPIEYNGININTYSIDGSTI